MAVKIKVEVTCDGCGKALSLDGREVHGRRSNYVYVDSLWVVETGDSEVAIKQGPDTDSIRENYYEAVCCGIPCVLKVLPKHLKKYEKEKQKELQEELASC